MSVKPRISLTEKLFFAGYLFTTLLLFLYTFTQIDIDLTLNRLPLWQQIQHAFQYIGWFNRPLSRAIFLGILFLMYSLYFTLLYLVRHKKITMKTVSILLLVVTVILTFSYNAFSYDLFNYIFDAKIITFYHQNPYTHFALNFPNDPMLGFMRWTHRVYPYGPIWLVLTVPLSVIGHQYFLPTLILFKLLASGAFIGTVYFLRKTVEFIKPEKALMTVAFFAFNPLVLIECLVSAHNDIVMLFFAVVVFYTVVRKQYVVSVLSLLVSIGVKFATLFLAPILGIMYYLSITRKKIDFESFFLASALIMVLAVVVATGRTGDFQPWYLLYSLTFASLVSYRYYVMIPSIVVSLFGLLVYVPFLYTGNWDAPTQQIITELIYVSIVISIVATALWSMRLKFLKHHI